MRIRYRWFDGDLLRNIERDFVPRVGDHVVLDDDDEPMKVESVFVDERDGQVVTVTLNVGDY